LAGSPAKQTCVFCEYKETQKHGEIIFTGDFIMGDYDDYLSKVTIDKGILEKVIIDMERQKGNECGICALDAVLRAYGCGKEIPTILATAKREKSTIGAFPITLFGEIPVVADIPKLVEDLGLSAQISACVDSVGTLISHLDNGKILMVPFYVKGGGGIDAGSADRALRMPHWCVVWGYCGDTLLVSHGWRPLPYKFGMADLVTSNKSIVDITVEAVKREDKNIEKMLEDDSELEETLKPKLATGTNTANMMVVFKKSETVRREEKTRR
jgi:hypothetical protein